MSFFIPACVNTSHLCHGETFERDYGSQQEMVNLGDTQGTCKGGD